MRLPNSTLYFTIQMERLICIINRDIFILCNGKFVECSLMNVCVIFYIYFKSLKNIGVNYYEQYDFFRF